MRTAVHDAVMDPESRLAHHCASAGLVQSEPVIEQAKKYAVPVGHGSPADPKRLARAGTLAFVLLSANRGREQCGDRGRDQESASLHCSSNAQQERGFLTEKVPANVRPNGLPVIRQFPIPPLDPWHGTAGPILELISRFPPFE